MVDKSTDHGKPFVVDLLFTMTPKVLGNWLAEKEKIKLRHHHVISMACTLIEHITRPIQRARNHSVMVKSVFDENAEARNLRKMKFLLR